MTGTPRSFWTSQLPYLSCPIDHQPGSSRIGAFYDLTHLDTIILQEGNYLFPGNLFLPFNSRKSLMPDQWISSFLIPSLAAFPASQNFTCRPVVKTFYAEPLEELEQLAIEHRLTRHRIPDVGVPGPIL